MKIKVFLNKSIIQTIKIQITNPKDPLVLYLLKLSEEEYVKIMKDQKILINFSEFPNFLLNLSRLCGDQSSQQDYFASINLGESPEVIFTIEEKIKFKITEHIMLKLRKANEEEIKKYLSKIYLDIKNKYLNTFNKLNDANIKYECVFSTNEKRLMI